MMQEKIYNLSDQLLLYSNEVVRAIEDITKKTINDKPITLDNAIKIVDIATRDMLVDAIHHLPDEINETLVDITAAMNNIAEK
ncbi:MAG: hypothetical protein PHN69_06530 [Candidatus Pacebacteria bacterium]|nr:hypothetical protein [Candidatus Paceibacterota bacterium]